MSDLVSIIIPTFNRAHTLPDTLKSVQNQTHQNWECLIIDDGSTDDTDSLIQQYCEKDERFQYIKRPENRKKGAATCRNIGLENFKGDYVQYLDSDDLLAANKFEEQIKSLKKSKAEIAICKWGVIKNDLSSFNIYDHLPTYKNFNKGIQLFDAFGYYFTYFPPHVYLAGSDLVKKAGKWNEELTLNDDGDYFSKLLFNCEKVVFSEETHVFYRRGEKQRISSDYSEYGIQSFIDSWTDIDNRIQEKFNISNHIFVRQARRNMFSKIEKKHPQIIQKNQEFFRKRMSNSEYYFRKIISKLKGYS